MATPAQEFGKRYILLDRLGAGGMGIVYTALDRLTRQHVALKQLTAKLGPRRSPVAVLDTAAPTITARDASPGSGPTASRDRRLELAREFQVLASVRHPNVITVLDYGFDSEGQPFYTMELLENAKDLLSAAENVPFEQKVELLVQVLRALAYLHRRDILHRDLKPSNVLVTSETKVLDFGLASRVRKSDSQVSGSVTHMAPELFERQPATEASDLYAFGIMAFQMLAGAYPFGKLRGSKAREVIEWHLHGSADYSLLPSPRLADVIRRLLDKDPARRWSNANQVIEAMVESSGLVIPGETQASRESFLSAAEFVGRDKQLGELTAAMKRAQGGHGEIWLLEGESGIGKSRLLDEVRDQALVQGTTVAWGQAAEHRAGWQVWRDPLNLLAVQTPLSDAEASLLKLLLPDLDVLLERSLPAPNVSSQDAKEQIVGLVRTIFSRQTRPLLVILEDLHWAPEALDLLAELAEVVSQRPILIIGSYRPEEAPRIAEAIPGAHVLRIGPLDPEAVTALVDSMLGPAAASPEIVDFLQRNTEGNAFFLVESVRELAEQAGQLSKVSRSTLPTRLEAKGVQTVVERRIALVPSEQRPFLELAAVLGREPDPDVLRTALGTAAVDRGFAACADLCLFEVRRNSWSFAHEKFREGVVRQLNPERLRRLHRLAGESIEGRGTIEENYATLAHHFQMAGDRRKEAQYCGMAGRVALGKGAYREARRFLERAIELRDVLPESDSSDHLDLLLRLGSVLITLCGWSAPEVRRTYDAAVALAAATGRETDVAPALVGLAKFAFFLGQLSEARAIGDRLLDLAAASGDPIIRQHGRLIQGEFAVWTGNFARDLHYADEIASLYKPEQAPLHISLYGQDPLLTSMVQSTIGTWMIGYPDRALERSRRSIEIAQRENNPFSIAIAYQIAAWVHFLRGELVECRSHALALGAVAGENGFPAYQVLAGALEGWVRARQGEGTRGVDQIRQAIERWKELHARFVLTLYSTILADACLHGASIAAGLEAAERALDGSLGTQERCYEPELHRLRGELLLQTGDSAAALGAFESSLASAAEQQAKSFEFRTVISLAKAVRNPSRLKDVRRRLFQLCSWFDDKGETPDMHSARELLLSPPHSPNG